MEQSTLHRRGLGLRGVDSNLVSPGYTLFAHLTSLGTVRLIANDGTEAHRWDLPYRPGRHARILANGNLAYNGVHPDSPRLFPLWQKYRGGVMQEIILPERLFMSIEIRLLTTTNITWTTEKSCTLHLSP